MEKIEKLKEIIKNWNKNYGEDFYVIDNVDYDNVKDFYVDKDGGLGILYNNGNCIYYDEYDWYYCDEEDWKNNLEIDKRS